MCVYLKCLNSVHDKTLNCTQSNLSQRPPPNSDHLPLATTYVEGFLYRKATSDRWPPVNNSHKFGLYTIWTFLDNNKWKIMIFFQPLLPFASHMGLTDNRIHPPGVSGSSFGRSYWPDSARWPHAVQEVRFFLHLQRSSSGKLHLPFDL